ncbi:hypothetical protein IFR05_007090 [Cadophora sp. M221]|nr:hypothetical protein IFR05_007090 [Cadophora sp. M221]
MAAVLRQLLVTKLDFQRLADDTGLSSAEAARSRWRRLKAKLEGCDSTDTSPSKTSVTLPNLQRVPVVKNGNGKRAGCMDKDDMEDDNLENNEKSVVRQEKRRKGQPKRAVVGKVRKAAVREEDSEEEAFDYISIDEMT